MSMPPREVFLSHSSNDRDFVAKLNTVLRRHGIPTWFSQTNILGAQQWHDEIGLALRRCDWFLLVLSQSAVDSVWVKRELLFALQQNRFRNKIVPLFYQDCDYEELSWVLPSFQYVDFRNLFEAGCQELLRMWGVAYIPDPAPTR
jgi:hypothetical protein